MHTSFLQRFCVQLRSELRLLLWPALAMPVVLLLRLWYRLPASAEDLNMPAIQGIASLPVRMLAQLLPVWMVFISIRADAPANSNTATLTRPLGGAAMWWAKLTSLALTIAVPWLIADLYIASTVPQSTASWLAIALSSVVNSLMLIALIATVGCITSSHTAAIGATLAAFVAWYCWDSGLEGVLGQMLTGDRASPTQLLCASAVGRVIALATAMIAWWFAMAKRATRASLATLAIGIVIVLLVPRVWPFDWLQRPALQLTNPLTLRLGKPDPKDSTPSQALWPTLRIAGLGKDEVAGVLAFAPVVSDKPWPGDAFTTDFKTGNGLLTAQWLTNDHVRPVMDHYAADDLWPHSERPNNPQRLPLAEVIKNPTQTWRLRVAVHRMRSIGECKLSDIIQRPMDFPVREGMSLRLGPERSKLNFYCGVQEMHSALIPERGFAPITHLDPKLPTNTPLGFHFLLVSHDPDARENRFAFDEMASYWGGSDSSRGLLRENTAQRGITMVWLPGPRIKLGFTTEERYQETTTVQVWITEDCGTQDFDLTPEQLQQVRAAH